MSKFIIELGNFDPKGQAFRYPESSRGIEFFREELDMDPWLYEKTIRIEELGRIAKKIIGDLEGLETYLDIQRENEEEALAIAY